MLISSLQRGLDRIADLVLLGLPNAWQSPTAQAVARLPAIKLYSPSATEGILSPDGRV